MSPATLGATIALALLGRSHPAGVVLAELAPRFGVSPERLLSDTVTLVEAVSALMGREIENIRSCDVVIFAGGRSGTLGEFAIAYDEAKVIGVLRSTCGITDHLETIIDMVDKETGSIVCCDDEPERLLDQLEEVYRRRIFPRHVSIMKSGSGPDGRLQS